jgi:hypothetical protein
MNDKPYVGSWKYKSGEPFICQLFDSISSALASRPV